jgi:hypothetical protein
LFFECPTNSSNSVSATLSPTGACTACTRSTELLRLGVVHTFFARDSLSYQWGFPTCLETTPSTFSAHDATGFFFPKSTRQANIDGAYFGTTFPHLYLMTHPDMIPTKPTQEYCPRVYGFRVHESSLYYLNREEDNNGQQVAATTSRQNRRSRRQPSRK